MLRFSRNGRTKTARKRQTDEKTVSYQVKQKETGTGKERLKDA